MWEIDSIHPDPLTPRDGQRGEKPSGSSSSSSSSEVLNSYILSASVPIDAVVGNASSVLSSFRQQEEYRGWRVGLADFCARHFRGSNKKRAGNKNNGVNDPQHQQQQFSVRMEALDEALDTAKRRRSAGRRRTYHPYVVERSDFYCCNESLYITVRVVLTMPSAETITPGRQHLLVRDSSEAILRNIFVVGDPSFRKSLLEHIASVVLQQKLRSNLITSLDAIAFVADGSILPRKSGTSDAPMASPPAVPFKAPSGSRMTIKRIEIHMGSLAEHVPRQSSSSSLELGIIERNEHTIVLSGLVVPKGITLICGGGYHGEYQCSGFVFPFSPFFVWRRRVFETKNEKISHTQGINICIGVCSRKINSSPGNCRWTIRQDTG